MAEDKFKWDKWSVVEDAIKRSSSSDNTDKTLQSRLLIVCIGNNWNPPAVALIKELERIRKPDNSNNSTSSSTSTNKSSSTNSSSTANTSLFSKLPIYIVDFDSEASIIQSALIHSNSSNNSSKIILQSQPQLLFYLNGKLLTIRRSDWSDSNSFSGNCNREQLVELFQSARSCEYDSNSSRLIQVEF